MTATIIDPAGIDAAGKGQLLWVETLANPAAPTVAAPAAPPPRNVRLSDSTSRAGGSSGAKGTGRVGKGSPHDRAGPTSMCMKPERG